MYLSDSSKSRERAEVQAQKVDQLVVNWHFTEACNYSCKYCYASWGIKRAGDELFRDEKATSELLRELFRFFSPESTTNPLRSRLKWSDIRLSLAGGEPLLNSKRTTKIVQEAKALGFKLSLITNASRLKSVRLDSLFRNLSILGISLDSADAQTCRKIGRVDKTGQSQSLDEIVNLVERVRSVNSEIIIKINTVVNECNVSEDLTKVVERINPDKWKVFKVLPIISDNLSISENQFQDFVNLNQKVGSVLSAENNEDMTVSYLMVDPLGRFFQNKDLNSGVDGTYYSYSRPILEIGPEAAFRQINFDVEKFVSRYSKSSMEVAA